MAVGLVVLNTLGLIGFLRVLAVPALSRISANCKMISEKKAMSGITIKVEGLITIKELATKLKNQATILSNGVKWFSHLNLLRLDC